MTSETRAELARELAASEPDLARCCLLVAQEADPRTAVEAGLTALDELAERVAGAVSGAGSAAEAASSLGRALGATEGFGGTPEDYADLRSSLLPDVLQRRRGLPILLSVVYVEVGRRLGVQVSGVGLPGHFVVRVDGPGGPVVLDPFGGGRVMSDAELDGSDLRPWPVDRTLLRVLANIRRHAAERGRTRTELWAVELSMLVPGHDDALRREHGALLVRLGDYAGGAAQLDAYAAAEGTDDDVAAAVRRAARHARSRLN